MRNLLRNRAFALALGGVAFLANPSFAVEPDTQPPAGPKLVAPHANVPDFQLDWACCDDVTIVEISPEGKPAIVEPEIVTGPPPVDREDLIPTR
jgi:hypothetical protein